MQTIKIYSRFDGSKVILECEGASVREAVLAAVKDRASLSGADLSGANLYGANLSGANLSEAGLSRANLYGADLSHVKADIWDVLFRAPGEVSGLLDALKSGRVNGSVYEGECACLVGTIANVARCHFAALELIKPNSSRPAEQWFLAISKGHTPETSSVVKLTVEWVEEFQRLIDRAISIRTSHGAI